MLKYLVMLEVTGLIFDSFLYPAIYKFGCEKSRLVLVESIMVILGMVLILGDFISTLDIGNFDIEGVIANIKKYALSYLQYYLFSYQYMFIKNEIIDTHTNICMSFFYYEFY